MRVGAGEAECVDPSRLTAQELAVARLVAVGMSNRQVASELFISIKTVQFHLTHVYAKLGVSSRAELAAQFRDVASPTTDGGEVSHADGHSRVGDAHLSRGRPRAVARSGTLPASASAASAALAIEVGRRSCCS